MSSKDDSKLPPPWCRERDAAEVERERQQLRLMRQFEYDAIMLGLNVRPIIKETKK